MSFLENIARDDVPENILAVLNFDIFFTQKEFDEIVSGSGTNAICRKKIPEGYRPTSFGYAPVDSGGNIISEVFTEITPFDSDLPSSPTRTWTFDRDNSQIYVRGLIAPEAGSEDEEFLAAGYNAAAITDMLLLRCTLPISQEAISWYLDPKDDQTSVVRFAPILQSSFELKSSFKDLPYGSVPNFSTKIDIDNSNGTLTPMLRSGKFAGAVAKIYRMSGTPRIDNVGLIFESEFENIRVRDESISLSLKSRRSSLNKEFVVVADKMSDVSAFTPARDRVDAKIKTIFGMARGLRCEVTEFNASITTSFNREWLVCTSMGETELSLSISASIETVSGELIDIKITEGQGWYFGSNDDARKKLRIGDRIRIVQGGATAYRVIVGPGEPGDIPIAPSLGEKTYRLDSPLGTSFDSGSCTVSRLHASRVFLNQDGEAYELMPFRDYTMPDPTSSDFIKLELTSSAESNVSANTINPTKDFISGAFYGPRFEHTTINMGDTPIRSSWNMPAVSHPAFVIYLLLTESGAMTTDDFSVDDLEDYYENETNDVGGANLWMDRSPIGMVEPDSSFANRRKIADILRDIAISHHLFIYNDITGKLRIKMRRRLGGTNFTVTEKDIIGDIEYTHDYGKTRSGATAQFDFSEVQNFVNEPSEFRQHTERSLIGRPFYEASNFLRYRCTTVPSNEENIGGLPYHSSKSSSMRNGPQRSANNVAQTAGLQRNIYKFKLKKSFSQIDYNDTITLKREQLPGFPFEKGILREITGNIVSISRSIDSVEIELEDSRMKNMVGRSLHGFI